MSSSPQITPETDTLIEFHTHHNHNVNNDNNVTYDDQYSSVPSSPPQNHNELQSHKKDHYQYNQKEYQQHQQQEQQHDVAINVVSSKLNNYSDASVIMQQQETIAVLSRALADVTKHTSSLTSPSLPAPLLSSSSLGNPASLGLAGFAATTFILSAYNTSLLSATSTKMVLPMAMWFGGAGQAAAGILEFIAGNTFGATAFVAYGCFWLSFATLVEFGIPEMTTASAADVGQAVGFYLLVWLIFSLYMFVASLRQSRLLVSVFATLVVALSLLVAGNFANDPNTIKAGGYVGLMCASLAFYGSAAVVINNSFNQVILPLGVYIHKVK